MAEVNGVSDGVEHSYTASADDRHGLECPITHTLMVDPVMTPSGYSFENVPLRAWIAQHGTCPLTRAPLKAEELIQNINLRQAIAAYQKVHHITPKPVPRLDIPSRPAAAQRGPLEQMESFLPQILRLLPQALNSLTETFQMQEQVTIQQPNRSQEPPAAGSADSFGDVLRNFSQTDIFRAMQHASPPRPSDDIVQQNEDAELASLHRRTIDLLHMLPEGYFNVLGVNTTPPPPMVPSTFVAEEDMPVFM